MGTASRTCTSCKTPLPDDAAFCPTCGAATPTAVVLDDIPNEFQDRLKNALADRYRIQRELGRGGMAIVYLAHDVRHERDVALKVLRPELAASLGADRFLREIRIAARLNHAHILALFDSGEANGFLYYVMPFVEGESLRDKLNRERQLPIDDALQVTKEVADALGHAHSLGIVHRDIKPENILFAAGHAVLSDFGIARAVSSAGGEALTASGSVVGTPAYMSPEQAAGDAGLDGRADVYSLACVLYEILGGEPPFTGPSAQAIIAKHALAPRPGVRTLRDTVSVGVELAVQRAMAKSPADRFASADAFVSALRAPPEAVDPERRVVLQPPTVHRAQRRLRRALLVGTLAVAAVVLASLSFPAIRSLIGRGGTRSYPELPDWPPWFDLSGEHFSLAAVAGSVLVIHRFGADSMYAYDGRQWQGMTIPSSFALRPYRGTIHDGLLLATKDSIAADGNPLLQYWWLEISPGGLRPLQPLGDFESEGILPSWWSDGHELVTWIQTPSRYSASGWVREYTGTAGRIRAMWGRDVDHRFALPQAPRDSLLVYDGISWRMQDIFPDRSSGQPALAGGTTLPDETTVVFGEACGTDSRCGPLILQQDRFGERWSRITPPVGVGMPAHQPAASPDPCVSARFTLTGAAGVSRNDYYVWGDWTNCHPGRPERVPAGCPPGQPCLWLVTDGTLHPVEDLRGKVILDLLTTPEAQYVLVDDGTLWRSVEDEWRFAAQVPDLPTRLVSVTPRLVVRWTGATVTYEPGSGDTVSSFFVASVPGLPAIVADRAPPRRVVGRDTVLALLAADGRVFRSICGRMAIEVGPRGHVLRCNSVELLPVAPEPVTDIGVLADGDVIGVGRRGLVVRWDEHAIHREHVPTESRSDSLWSVHVDEKGHVTAMGTRVLLERDSLAQWAAVRSFTGDGGVGNRFVPLPNGDIVVAGSWMRVWDRSAEAVPVATLHRPVLGEARVSALHVLSDGRLIAGFASSDTPGVRGWLQVWAVPAREDRWERVDLPMTIDVTDLTDDDVYLYVVGRGGSLAIPLAALPFGVQTNGP